MPPEPPDASTRLAADRTRLALERTLMAWVRTCTSMIAFGFGIYQFLQYLQTKETLRQPVISPQVFAVLLIVAGLTALALAWLQHRQAMRTLRTEFGAMPYSIAAVMAAFIAGIGVVALIGVGLRI
jgi:putative membrane protein